MNRKQIDRLKQSFAKRRGRLEMTPGTPPEITRAFLEKLIDCPDCRAVIVESCQSENRNDVDIDTVLRDLARQDGH